MMNICIQFGNNIKEKNKSKIILSQLFHWILNQTEDKHKVN
jgi:hypothetical protein